MTESYAKPLPRLTELNRPFWESTRGGRLAVQACRACGDLHFPPSPVCPRCLGDAQEWREVSGGGTLESWIDVYRAYWSGFAPELPYLVCLVRLDEGPLLVSNLVGDSEGAHLGARVSVVFETATADITIPKFALARGADAVAQGSDALDEVAKA
jgi:uncharacterized OB-fold protein